ncbi:MAG: choice-of-anchor Q domain-containing protein [Luteolibacter sp.]
MIQPIHHLLAALLLLPLAAHGTIVTTATDEDNGSLNGGAGISLREAVKYSPVGTTITFASALSGRAIRLTLGEILVSKSLTIDGSTLAARITVSGDRTGNGKTPDDYRVLRADADPIVLDSLIISGGCGTQGGGLISNRGTANLTVKRCHFLGNSASVAGGAIYALHPVQIQTSTFTGNSSQQGGAIFIESFGGMPVFEDTTFTGNSASMDGGAICLSGGSLHLKRSTIAGNSAQNGGGIFSTGYFFYLETSTVSGNSALLDGGGICAENGGITLRNSTVAQNTAGAIGGGIRGFDRVESEDCTIAANIATVSGGGIACESAYLRNTIVSANNAPSAPQLSGSLVQDIGNLLTPILSLAPLGNYGGPTQTMPPLIGSPAIDPPFDSSFLATDQRGYPRGSASDIGAVEYQGDRYPYEDASIINRVMPQIWNTDADGDGLPHGIEHLHGTNPFIPDNASPATLSVPVVNSAGHRVLTFTASQNTAIRDPDTHTFWYLMRSPDLRPGTWSEIYRFTPYGGYAKPGVTFTQVPDPAGGEKIRITVTDANPLPGGAFYRFQAVLGPQ